MYIYFVLLLLLFARKLENLMTEMHQNIWHIKTFTQVGLILVSSILNKVTFSATQNEIWVVLQHWNLATNKVRPSVWDVIVKPFSLNS